MASVSHVQATLIGAPVGAVLQIDDSVACLELFIGEISSVLFRWLLFVHMRRVRDLLLKFVLVIRLTQLTFGPRKGPLNSGCK